MGDFAPLLTDPASTTRLCDALRTSRRLHQLALFSSSAACWREPGMHAVLTALRGHPTLYTRTISTTLDQVGPPPTDEEQALAAMHIAALIAANAPALTSLNVELNFLSDVGAAPLIAAVRRNSYLRTLKHRNGNNISEDVSAELTLPVLPGDD
jgi:hypothetical protein